MQTPHREVLPQQGIELRTFLLMCHPNDIGTSPEQQYLSVPNVYSLIWLFAYCKNVLSSSSIMNFFSLVATLQSVRLKMCFETYSALWTGLGKYKMIKTGCLILSKPHTQLMNHWFFYTVQTVCFHVPVLFWFICFSSLATILNKSWKLIFSTWQILLIWPFLFNR